MTGKEETLTAAVGKKKGTAVAMPHVISCIQPPVPGHGLILSAVELDDILEGIPRDVDVVMMIRNVKYRVRFVVKELPEGIESDDILYDVHGSGTMWGLFDELCRNKLENADMFVINKEAAGVFSVS